MARQEYRDFSEFDEPKPEPPERKNSLESKPVQPAAQQSGNFFDTLDWNDGIY